MEINVFLLCYNESALLPHTIKHYKKYLPSCKITVYDNESTDNSAQIAKELGCSVIFWNSNNILNEEIQIYLRNTIWHESKGWIIVADMDEFLCITEDDLRNEMNNGVTILKIKGYDMIGESQTLDLTDIDLQEITKYVENSGEDKYLCFFREPIIDMNYGPGSHICYPCGTTIYSSNVYINKHMNYLGLNFIINKLTERYKRSEKMRKKGWSCHYTNDVEEIKKRYTNNINMCKYL
jgi:glycosyltransferase involved in cell wall biosynthesis